MSSMEDLLFYTITDGKEMIPLSQFISVRQQHIYISSVTLSTVLAFHGPCEHTQTHSTTPLTLIKSPLAVAGIQSISTWLRSPVLKVSRDFLMQ